jgi:hypothetical protein
VGDRVGIAQTVTAKPDFAQNPNRNFAKFRAPATALPPFGVDRALAHPWQSFRVEPEGARLTRLFPFTFGDTP